MIVFKELKQSAHVIYDYVIEIYQWIIGWHAAANVLMGFIVALAALLLLAIANFVIQGTVPVPAVPTP